MMHRWLSLVIVMVGAQLMTSPVLAQEGTPAANEENNPRIVSPSECQVAPRDVAEIAQILQLDAEGVPLPPYSTITAPLGVVADAETKISIKEAARSFLACVNAGDIPRAAALMTKHGVQRSYWALTSNPAAREAATARLAAPPQPRPAAAQIRFLTMTDTSVLPDGRIAVFVVINDPLVPPGQKTLLVYFTKPDERWLIDDWVDFSIAAAATPTP